MPIQRHIHGPEVGFFERSVYETFGFCDIVRAGDHLHCGGIVPLRGEVTDIEVVGAGDFRAQYAFVLETLAALFERSGARFPQDVVDVKVMSTDMTLVNQNSDIFTKAFAGTHPALTYIGVAQLFHPEQLIEVSATAYIGA
jgi:enamine deaminase RidA (YjgF/YER057c/UK114 family)